MPEHNSDSPTVILKQRWLWCVKLAAVALSFPYAVPHLPFVGEPALNFLSTTFYIALAGLLPNLGWSIPSLVIGFWLTPMLFAFRVNGSSAEDLTTAIIGGTIGIAVGLVLDTQTHLANTAHSDRNQIVTTLGRKNAG